MRRLWPFLLAVLLAGLLVWWAWPQIERARQYAALLAAPGPTASSLPSPLPGLPLTDTWGGARSEGRRHEGIDIFARRDTPIRSATRGVVSRVGPDRLGGRTVTVTGPGGYHHYYAHLERYAKLSRGDWVQPGTVLGYVGDSGNARGTPTHLHYGVYTPTWRAMNPYPLLRKGTALTPND